MTDLDRLVPPTRTVVVGGREIVATVLRIRQIPGFSKAIAEPFPLIVMGDYLAVIMEYSDKVVDALHIATGAERDFLKDLDAQEFLMLATAVFEVNLDFFARAVLPAATALGATMRAVVTTPSPSLPGSSSLDTATPTSLTSPLPN